jgi:hypothetical protein
VAINFDNAFVYSVIAQALLYRCKLGVRNCRENPCTPLCSKMPTLLVLRLTMLLIRA